MLTSLKSGTWPCDLSWQYQGGVSDREKQNYIGFMGRVDLHKMDQSIIGDSEHPKYSAQLRLKASKCVCFSSGSIYLQPLCIHVAPLSLRERKNMENETHPSTYSRWSTHSPWEPGKDLWSLAESCKIYNKARFARYLLIINFKVFTFSLYICFYSTFTFYSHYYIRYAVLHYHRRCVGSLFFRLCTRRCCRVLFQWRYLRRNWSVSHPSHLDGCVFLYLKN